MVKIHVKYETQLLLPKPWQCHRHKKLLEEITPYRSPSGTLLNIKTAL